VIAMRLVTAAFAAFVALPLLWLVYAAFIPAEALVRANLATFGFSLENFAALRGTGLWRVDGGVVLRHRPGGRRPAGLRLGAAYAIRNGLRLLALVMLLLALPSELLLVPLYRQLQTMALIDTLGALVVPFLASPLIVFLLLQGLRRVPWEVIEAARLDGAGEVAIVRRIVAPILRPELTASAVLAFAAHWNLVLYPRIMTTEPYGRAGLPHRAAARPRRSSGGCWAPRRWSPACPLIVLYLSSSRSASSRSSSPGSAREPPRPRRSPQRVRGKDGPPP
jgi:multiple sugar transport system permease protein